MNHIGQVQWLAQTPTHLLDGGRHKPSFGDCAVHSEPTVLSLDLDDDSGA